MEKILIATGNKHKVQEFKNILSNMNLDIDLVCPADFNDDSEPEENGKTYAENSYIKAKYYFDKYHLPTLADDSGIEIDFYNGAPGIYSARFLSGKSYREKNLYILEEMKNSTNRKAFFKCYVTYIDLDGKSETYEGIVEGNISKEISGVEGFGYDPIFIPVGETKTNAELGQEFKDKNSHRSIALRKWAKDFEKKQSH